MFPLHPSEDPDWLRLKAYQTCYDSVLIDHFLDLGGGIRVELTEAQSVRIFRNRLREVIPSQSFYEVAPYIGNATWTIIQTGKITVANVESQSHKTEDLFRQIERELAHENDSFRTVTIRAPRLEQRTTNATVPEAKEPTGYHEHVCNVIGTPVNTITEKFPSLKSATGEALDAIAFELGGVLRIQGSEERVTETDEAFRRRVLVALGVLDQA